MKWGQSHLGGVSHTSGSNIVVRIKIFSIVVGLGFLNDQSREFGL